MGLFDFDLHDLAPERKTLHDISADGGETWITRPLTPTEVLCNRACGYMTRPHFTQGFWAQVFADQVRLAFNKGYYPDEVDAADPQVKEEIKRAFEEIFRVPWGL